MRHQPARPSRCRSASWNTCWGSSCSSGRNGSANSAWLTRSAPPGFGAQQDGIRAASLPTLLNMVAAGYGTTLVPGLAAGAAQDSGIVLRPLAARADRTVRIAWRAHYPRRAAVEAVGAVIAARLRGFAEAGAAKIG